MIDHHYKKSVASPQSHMNSLTMQAYQSQPYSPTKISYQSSLSSKNNDNHFFKNQLSSFQTSEQHMQQHSTQPNQQFNQQASYYNYLNSFYNDNGDQNLPKQPSQVTSSRKCPKVQENQNIYNQQQQQCQMGKKKESKILYKSNAGPQIVSLKKAQQLHDKYQVYTNVDPIRSTATTHSSAALNSMQSHSQLAQHHKLDSFRLGGSPSIHEKRSTHQMKKSFSKENFSNHSSRGVSKRKDSIKLSQNNTSAKETKHKSKITHKQPDQIIDFYLSQESKQPPTNKRASDAIRIERGDSNMRKVQQQYQSIKCDPTAHKRKSETNSQSNQRNHTQLKLLTLNNGNSTSNIESFENINSQLNSLYALSTKNSNNYNALCISQGGLKSPSKESFQGSTVMTRNINANIYDQNDYSEHTPKTSSQLRIQQKIQKIIKATSMGQTTGILQNSSSQNHLKEMNTRIVKSKINSSSQSTLFRPQSLNQLVPSVDDQIMKLTANTNQHPANHDQQILIRAKAELIKQPSQILNSVSSPTVQQMATYYAKIQLADADINSDLNQKQQQSTTDNEYLITNTSSSQIKQQKSDASIKQQLQDILFKTQLTLKAYQKKESLLQFKCNEQAQEISFLKLKLKKYEPDN